MAVPILATKIYTPPPPAMSVARPRLIEQINRGLHRKLTLVSAPAGFGKTTLLSAWAAGCTLAEHPRVAWLSLEEGDSDLARFLAYLLAALRTVAPGIGEGLAAALQSRHPLPPETLLTALLNDISALSSRIVMVLDDYHAIEANPVTHSGPSGAAESHAVDAAVAFILEHMPPQLRLVIATRADPALPLARLRARGSLGELRAADLRFTPAEAADFLNSAMDLNLSPGNIATLETRTEGWIAGLQLAALSMQNHRDVAGFIRAFAGDHRYIMDYLVEEVLQRQPEGVRAFLLQTSILDRLNGSLCDAVTGRTGGSVLLEALERSNFFVVPLDDTRQWYRYHHLFADVLRAHLTTETADEPGRVTALHMRAGEWYRDHGSAADAIRHSLAADDFEGAAAMIELAIPELRKTRQEATFLAWLKALPDEVIRARPVLSANYAGVLLATGALDDVESRLQDAERLLETPGAAYGIAGTARPADFERERVVDEEAFRRLPGSIAVWRAGLALVRGDVPGTIRYARQALDLVSEDHHLERGGAVGLLGLAYWASGDLEAAHHTFADGMASVQKAGFESDTVNSAIALAEIRIGQGRLREALRTYEQALHLAQTAIVQGDFMLKGTADICAGMSELELERNNLHAAMEHLRRGEEAPGRTGFQRNGFRWCVAMSRLQEAQGDLEGALDMLREAERLYVSDFFPNVRPVSALRARVWIAHGMTTEALAWARERGMSLDANPAYLHEFEHITYARLLLALHAGEYAQPPQRPQHPQHAQSSLTGASNLLNRLLVAAEEGGRGGSIIEILVLLALAGRARGDSTDAMIPLQRAITLAEPEGYVRIFVDEGIAMAQLLQAGISRGVIPGYARKLLAALEGEHPEIAREIPLPISHASLTSHTAPAPVPATSRFPAEPLSPRELAVLQLFQSEMTGPEIAGELMIALSTLRTHTKGIYSKLNVSTRRAAVKRAAELGLLRPR